MEQSNPQFNSASVANPSHTDPLNRPAATSGVNPDINTGTTAGTTAPTTHTTASGTTTGTATGTTAGTTTGTTTGITSGEHAGAKAGNTIQRGWHMFHGAGEELRGNINAFVDSATNFRKDPQVAEKDKIVASEGAKEMDSGRFGTR